jgi:hypothetical protein
MHVVIAMTTVSRASQRLQLVGRHLAALAVLDELEAHLLAFVQRVQTGTLHRADMNENVRSTIIRFDEAKAPSRIEEFYSSGRHVVSPNHALGVSLHAEAKLIDVWKDRQRLNFRSTVQVVKLLGLMGGVFATMANASPQGKVQVAKPKIDGV